MKWRTKGTKSGPGVLKYALERKGGIYIPASFIQTDIKRQKKKCFLSFNPISNK